VRHIQQLQYTDTHIYLTAFFSRTTWVSRHQKGKPFWILLKQEMMGWQWHQLDHMQIICKTHSRQITYQYLITQFLWAGCSSWRPTNTTNSQSTEGNNKQL